MNSDLHRGVHVARELVEGGPSRGVVRQEQQRVVQPQRRTCLRQRIQRRRRGELVRGQRGGGEGLIHRDGDDHAVAGAAEIGGKEGRPRDRRVEGTVYAALGGEDGEALAGDVARPRIERGHLHRAALEDRLAAGGDQVARSRTGDLHRIGRAGSKADVARHIQRPRRVARRHRAARGDAHRPDGAGASQRAASEHVDRSAQRAVHRQQPLRHRGGAREGRAVTGETERRGAGLGEGAEARQTCRHRRHPPSGRR